MSQGQHTNKNIDIAASSSAQNVIAPNFHGTIYTQNLHTGVGNINIAGSSSKGR